MPRPAATLAAVLLAAVMLAPPALAHKVVAAAYPSGDVIEGEVGFSNGDMAADTPIAVFDPSGTRMGEARTDADGFFTYTPTRAVTHVFRADLGAGHVVEFTLAAEDVPAVAADPAPAGGAWAAQASEARGLTGTTAGATVAVTPEIEAMIAAAVRNEVRPLRREIAAYKEKNDLQTILGGIGYIVGLFGLAFFLLARRQTAGGGAAPAAAE
ncbi:cobalt ABC transporter permease [Roseospira goensis]|uniref:Nickel transport protein n=1 Tax=Roseospira goensis TaxID=391922 RepID=A0A7W6RXZ2_9PROT|nr:cobalt ABC transporter permease [Roseospira goensis]MBB4285306.1 nickel transport protein [Roseospira goensis]